MATSTKTNPSLWKRIVSQVKSGSKYKMVPIFSDRLYDYPDVIDLFDDQSLQYVEIEFDPVDPQLYFFSTSMGLFK